MSCTVFQGPNGDWQIVNGRLVLTRDPVVVAATKIRNRLKFFLGEWYADIRLGVPYREVVFTKGADKYIIARIVRNVILSLAPTIEEVTRLDVGLDHIKRRGVIYFEARANDQRPISGGTEVPFIVGSEYLPPT